MDKILVVDDSPNFRNILSSLLAPLNLEIHTAQNGIEGVRQVVRHAPYFVTLDYEMPTLNGRNMIQILDLIGLAVPVIFITSLEEVLPDLEKLPLVAGVIAKKDLKEKLLPLAREIMAAQSERKYNDFDYQLSHAEFQQLIGKRDRQKILVVDDSKALRESLLRYLGKLNLFELYEAEDGREGVLKSLMIKPDLIISDINMPQVNGLMMAQMLYILGHPFGIFFLSGVEDEKVHQLADALEGVLEFFPKKEVSQKPQQFTQSIMKHLQMTDDKKLALSNAYQSIDMDRLQKTGSLEFI